ncbi:hypothetical protein N1I81_22825 [Bacillus sp. FSL M8-0052]|uniref:Uncharacterized protein n=1 Tax=Bacillus glycinifermentans TaxID=1664069 RepID=A0AAJ3Z338_9BACI|nr:hypothetical protein [Bacillus glycinifermentans]QAT68026.1 hypothetical protein EQZ20_24445 [Bacillus glycinifermentans]
MKLNLYSFTVINDSYKTISGTVAAPSIKAAREEIKKTYAVDHGTTPYKMQIKQIKKLVISHE